MATCSAILLLLPVLAQGQATCSLWLSPTLQNPLGSKTCLESGTPLIDKGKSCSKMEFQGLIFQQCDYTIGHAGPVYSCDVVGNPTSCCTMSTGAKIICGSFTTAPAASDFATCSTPCNEGGAPTPTTPPAVATTAAPPAGATTAAPPAGATTAAPASTSAPSVFDLYLRLLNVVDSANSIFTNQAGAAAAFAKAIAKAFGIDVGRVQVTHVYAQGAGGRRLQSNSGINVAAAIQNPLGDVTPAKAASANANLPSAVNTQLQSANINATVGSVEEGIPPPVDIVPIGATAAPTTAAPSAPNPCAPVTAAPNPCASVTTAPNPCAAVAKDAVGAKVESGIQLIAGVPTSMLLISMCLLLSCVAIGVVMRTLQRKTRESLSYKPMQSFPAEDIEELMLE